MSHRHLHHGTSRFSQGKCPSWREYMANWIPSRGISLHENPLGDRSVVQFRAANVTACIWFEENGALLEENETQKVEVVNFSGRRLGCVLCTLGFYFRHGECYFLRIDRIQWGSNFICAIQSFVSYFSFLQHFSNACHFTAWISTCKYCIMHIFIIYPFGHT